MTQTPAGWYPDPTPLPDQPPGSMLRWWDGIQWTAHVTPIHAGDTKANTRPTTPDGQPLAGWWERVAAAVLDALILMVPMGLISAAFFATSWDSLTPVGPATGPDGPLFPDTTTGPLAEATPWPVVAWFLSLAVVSAAYTIGFWRWKQATPGKMLLGIQVRRRESPGGLPWGTIIVRFSAITLLSWLAEVPMLQVVGGLLLLLNYLWPLWDSKNQALHDKVAGTNVVRKVRGSVAPEQPLLPAGQA